MKRIQRLFAVAALILTSFASAHAARVDLPDFTGLVDEVGPAVVNIEATRTAEAQARDGRSDEEAQMEEFFRRFFGQPGGPGTPGMPRTPRDAVSMGTGFFISGDGYVLTNHHVIEGADELIVRLSDRRELTAKVVGSDPLSDVALLKVDGSGLPALKLADSKTLKPGQWVIAIGSPFGFDHSVTAGIVSGVNRRSFDTSQQYVPFIQTDVAINRGNSGGPLLNTEGEVVGINSQIFSNSGGYMGVSFAIPIEVAMNAVDQLKSKGRVSRGQLGVLVQEVNRDHAKALGMSRPAGALVSQVLPGSPAAKAGIKVRDVIIAFNDRSIDRSADLPPTVGALQPGTRATVEVLRDGKTLELPVVLTELKDASAAAAGTPEAAEAATGNALGIVVDDLDAEQRRQLELESGEGVVVSRIAGLAARRAGLNPGDIILMVGRTPVGTASDFDKAVQGVKPGDTVMLLVRRGDQTSFVTVTPRKTG